MNKIIYNVTINIEDSVHEEWLQWMQNKHIQDVLNTQCFESAKLIKVLVDDPGGVTYSVQYVAKSREQLENYKNNFAPKLRQEGLEKFADKMIAFRTELEILSTHE